MDTKKDSRIPQCGILPKIDKNKVVVGAKQLRKAILAGRAKMVILAENADFALTEPLEATCLSNHIPFTWVPNMKDLGHACGIDVGAAAAAVVDETVSTGISP